MVTQQQWWPALEAAAKALRKKALDLRRDFNRKKMKTARVKCRRRMGLPKSGELDALLGKGGSLSEAPLRHSRLIPKRHPDGIWLQASGPK